MQRPAVQAHLEEVQRKFISEAEGLRASAKTRALQVAIELLGTTTNENIKVRLIEFLAGEGKAPQVAVNVDARNMHAGGYAYPPELLQGGQPKAVEHE